MEKQIKNKRNSVLTGVTGEYYVAAELSRMGYIASVTLRNTRGVDILCSNAEATKTVSIQVKTGSKNRHSWIVGEKGETYHAQNHFYVFVTLDENLPPEYTVVPSKFVAEYIKEDHKNWLSVLSKKGEKHKNNSMRKFRDLEEKYLNNWNVLGLN